MSTEAFVDTFGNRLPDARFPLVSQQKLDNASQPDMACLAKGKMHRESR